MNTNTPIMLEESVLNTPWVDPQRPYSNKELLDRHHKFFKSLRLSSVFAKHEYCGHAYSVKENGVKYKEMKNAETSDVGKCSVCWKLRQTPRQLKTDALDFVDLYLENFDAMETLDYTYYTLELERVFYTWLYNEYFN